MKLPRSISIIQLVGLLCSYFAAASASSQAYDLIPPLPLDAPLNYDFRGSTVVGRKHVKLTTDISDQRGWIVSKAAEPLPENFIFTMEFSLQGGGRNLYGDGMGLWFLEDEPKEGSMMGLEEFYKGTSILVDTYRNGRPGRVFPRLLIAQNDGTQPYDKDHDGVANEIDGCGLRGLHNNKRQEYNTIRVSYSRSLKSMVVDVNFRHKWETCAYADIDMGPVKRIAASAATGELSESVIIKSLQLIDLGASIPPAVSDRKTGGKNKKELGKESEKMGHSFFGSLFFLFKLIFKGLLLVLLLYIVFRGWKEFQKYQRSREDSRYKLL